VAGKAWQKIAGMEGGKVAINKILTLINSKIEWIMD